MPMMAETVQKEKRFIQEIPKSHNDYFRRIINYEKRDEKVERKQASSHRNKYFKFSCFSHIV